MWYHRNISEEEGKGKGSSREDPPQGPGREEACDERSEPQDVTSSWARREGVNLQQEVEPHQTERPPRNSLQKDTASKKPAAEMNIQADGAGITAFRCIVSWQPA